MTADADWIDDLERKAKAATPDPTRTRGRVWLIALDPDGDVRLPEGMRTDLGRREDAEFIAAANPATILRLIKALREADAYRALYVRTVEEWNDAAADFRELEAERDRWKAAREMASPLLAVLAAKVAAVEALAAETERAGDPLLRLDRLRAALSAAPTDTTKETP